jgi:hypothetical protein
MPKHSTYRHPSYIQWADDRDDKRRARATEWKLRSERQAAIARKAAFLGGAL